MMAMQVWSKGLVKMRRSIFCWIITAFWLLHGVEPLHAQQIAVANIFAQKVAEQILSQGGNAFDAGIASLLVLTVTDPFSTGLGGGAIFSIYRKGAIEPVVVDSRGKVPKNTDPDVYYQFAGDFDYLTKKGEMSVCTPGFLAGCDFVLKNYGDLTWQDVAKYAIELAKNGAPASKALKELSVKYYDDFIESSYTFSYFFPDWVPPGVGDMVSYPDLAATLQLIAQNGVKEFYQGKLADKIIADFANSKNQITKDDLQNFACSSKKPLSIDFMGYKIYAPSLPSVGGIALLATLELLEKSMSDSVELNSGAEVESFVLAYEKGVTELGKYVLAGNDLSHSSQQHFLANIRNVSAAKGEIEKKFFAPFLFNEGQGAASIVIRDERGNVFVANSALNDYFGAKLVADSTGILLNNFMANFAPLDGLENSIASGKQPFTFLMPIMVFKDGSPVLALAANGAAKNVLAMARFIYYFCKKSMSPLALMKMARFHYNPVKNTIVIEARFSAETLEYLKNQGYRLDFLRKFDILFGNFQLICLDPVTNQFESISDVRREGEIYVEF